MKALVAGLALVLVGCGSDPKVVRVYDGRIVEGAFVPSEAYSAYLRGVLAEEAGDLRSALAAYDETLREDDEDPEPYTRVGDVRCRLDPKGKGADEAFAQASSIDPRYAPLLAARARCAALRGDAETATAVAQRVLPEDRASASMEAVFVRIAAQRAPSGADISARERAIALTLASGEHPSAWDALVAWGRARSDAELVARGLEGLARVAPLRMSEVEAGALGLLGDGRTALARRVAAHVADAPDDSGVVSVHDATIARLAVDEALVRGDAKQAERRAVRGHVSLAEVAARAWLLGQRPVAVELATSVLAADPTASGAAMVLATTGARALKAVPGERPPAACVLVLAERLSSTGQGAAARTWLGRVSAAPFAPHDPVVGPIAIDLAARGVLPDGALPSELRLELAARRRDAPPAIDVASIDSHVVDTKHALLWHVLVDPTGAPARILLARLASAADRDPIVGYALARAALAAAPNPEALAKIRASVATSPSDPLLLAVAVELAKRTGRAEDVPPARARLMAVARTPAERSLASDQ